MYNQENDMMNYINEIAEKLWSGHAAAMIGTGFSMNAKPKFETEKTIPLWNDLGLKFMEKLGMDTKNENCLFQDPIKLASEISANFGENTLNQILIDSIPDMEYEPSELHKNFLKLNWTDVFTTNYDTLLERASENIGVKHYSLVTKDYDLVNAIKPRIIKLHGSFPSTVPFIITEEQYRSYPKTHAAFVNTVQQALVENILVLIGFSGTDPNFLNWIGWIRDNLGTKLTNKIYLISVNSISNAKMKLFCDRNINVVDLTVFNDSEKTNKSSLLSFFIKQLTEKKTKDKLEWANELCELTSKDIASVECYKKLESERKSYPGWIILPKHQRNQLHIKTFSTFTNYNIFKNLTNSETSINIIYEINWRWEKCLYPLYTNMQKVYEKVLGLDEIKKTVKIDSFEKSIQEKGIELILALYRSYREDANRTKCELLAEILNGLIQKMTLSQKHRYTYEKILYASLSFNYRQFIEEIENWDITDAAPIWQIKKAGLLAEIGKSQDALIQLNTLLQQIRKQQGKKDIIDEYYLLSIENLIMTLMSYIQNIWAFSNTNSSYIDNSELTDRTFIFKKYKCDILEERDSFDFHSNQIKKELSTDNFDIDKITKEINFNNSIPEEYSFLRFLEEIGYPYTLGIISLDSRKINYALKRVIVYYPEWSLSLLIRTYKKNSVKFVLARNVMLLFNSEDITRIITNLINVVYLFKNELSFSIKYNSFANRIIEPLFEIISRFCTKTGMEEKRKICVLLKDVINEEMIANPRVLDSFIQRVMKSLSKTEKRIFLPILLDIKFPNDGDALRNPCMYLDFYKDNTLNDGSLNEISEKIDAVISSIEKSHTEAEKRWYIDALISMFYLDALNTEQKEKLKNIVWSLPLDENGLPILSHFHKFVITDLPCPDSIDIKEMYKKCMLKTKIDILSNSNIRHEFSSPFWYDITIGLNNSVYFTDEYCIHIINQMKESWEKDSNLLFKDENNPFFSDKDTMQTTYRLSAEIIAKIILYRCNDLLDCNHQLNNILTIIKELLNNYKTNNIQCLPALIASILISPENKKEYLDLIELKIISNVRTDVIDTLNAIAFIFDDNEIKLEENEFKKLLELLSDSILWQAKGDFVDCLKTFALFLRKHKSYPVNEIIIEKVLRGLKNIRISLYETNSSLEEEIAVKAACAELANALFTYYNDKDLLIPDEIKEWQKICTNLEDFVEIRNPWASVNIEEIVDN